MITFVLTGFSSLVFILFTIGSHKDTTGRGLNLYPMSHLNPWIRALASHSFLRTSNIVIRQKYKAYHAMKAVGVLSLTAMWRHLFAKLNNACLIKAMETQWCCLGRMTTQDSDVRYIAVSYLHLGSEYTSVIFTYIKNCYSPPGVSIHVYLERSES